MRGHVVRLDLVGPLHRSPGGRIHHRLTAAAACVLLLLPGCGGGSADPDEEEAPPLAVSVDQLRRDQVLQRVQVAVENRGAETVVVDRLEVRIPGFRGPAPIAKDSPVAPGRVVNLPWPYGTVRCVGPEVRAPTVRRPVVTLVVHTSGDPSPRRVRLRADDGGLLQRIAERSCAVRRIQQEVALRFDDTWRAERRPGGVVLHGLLRARLLVDEPRQVTQVAGAILYGLRPDDSAGPVARPLADLSPQRPSAAVPVLAYAARCDGHTIGEIKKPYEFLVWVGAPGADPLAVTPVVGDATKKALRLACAF